MFEFLFAGAITIPFTAVVILFWWKLGFWLYRHGRDTLQKILRIKDTAVKVYSEHGKDVFPTGPLFPRGEERLKP